MRRSHKYFGVPVLITFSLFHDNNGSDIDILCLIGVTYSAVKPMNERYPLSAILISLGKIASSAT